MLVIRYSCYDTKSLVEILKNGRLQLVNQDILKIPEGNKQCLTQHNHPYVIRIYEQCVSINKLTNLIC